MDLPMKRVPFLFDSDSEDERPLTKFFPNLKPGSKKPLLSPKKAKVAPPLDDDVILVIPDSPATNIEPGTGADPFDDSDIIVLEEPPKQNTSPSKSQATPTLPPAKASGPISQQSQPSKPSKRPPALPCKASIDASLVGELFKVDDLAKLMEQYEVSYELDSCPSIEQTVRWTNGSSAETDGEEHLLAVVMMPEFVEMVHAYCADTGAKTLHDYAQALSERANCRSITILVNGLKSYFRIRQNKANAEFRAAINGQEAKKSRRKTMGLPQIERSDIDEALVDMETRSAEIDLSVTVHWTESSEEVARLIAAITKAINEAPAKRRRNEQMGFAWYVQGDSVCTVDPKNAAEAGKLWRRQLQQFPKVSKDIAQAIASTYTSPLALMSAYGKCQSTVAASVLLADIQIGARRLGPELSKRLHLFFSSTDGEKFIA